MRSRIDLLACALVVAFVLFLVLFGGRVHFIEVPNSAEMDGYAGKADEILSGALPRDPYHPLLYPLLAAGAGIVTGDGFSGARLVSTLSAGLFAFMTYLVGRRCFGRGVGFFALAATIFNFNVITMGMDTATDMTFAALALLVLFLSIRIGDRASAPGAVALALSFALAYFTRYSALFFLPAIAVAFFCSLRGEGARRRFGIPALFAGAAVVFLIPHFALTTRVFGSPLYNENWRNLAFKMYGNYDWNYFRNAPYDGLASVVLSSPARLAAAFARELARFFQGTLVELGGKGLAGGLFAAFALTGLYRALFSLDRKRLILVSFAFFYVALGCAFFYSGPRFMLPVLPLGYLWGGSILLEGPFSGSLRIGRRLAGWAPLAAVFMLSLCLTTAVHMRMYVAAHPVRELEAARAIERTQGRDLTVLGTFPYMQRYVKYRYLELADAEGEEIARPELYLERLRLTAQRENADFLIVGKLFMRNRPLGLLSGENVPDFLEPVSRDADVVVYRIQKGPLD